MNFDNVKTKEDGVKAIRQMYDQQELSGKMPKHYAFKVRPETARDPADAGAIKAIVRRPAPEEFMKAVKENPALKEAKEELGIKGSRYQIPTGPKEGTVLWSLDVFTDAKGCMKVPNADGTVTTACMTQEYREQLLREGQERKRQREEYAKKQQAQIGSEDTPF